MKKVKGEGGRKILAGEAGRCAGMSVTLTGKK